jgi:putative Mg2+ transporter-C (MgtC) family protein
MAGESVSQIVRQEWSSIVPVAAIRLLVAAILGGFIGLNREIKHRPAGIRTNMFMAIGSCLFTMLSSALSVGGDHTRIASQIITGIGFIGAGSILHERRDLVIGLTTAATIFVVASIGMAVGGGLYLTATFATAIALTTLFVLGKLERQLNLKLMICAYEVSGPSREELTLEINHMLEPTHVMMRNLQVAPTRTSVRVQFELEGTRKQQQEYVHMMRRSPLLQNLAALGPIEQE